MLFKSYIVKSQYVVMVFTLAIVVSSFFGYYYAVSTLGLHLQSESDLQSIRQNVWREEITLITSNIKNAGTPDPVSIQFEHISTSKVWLDHSKNDRMPGSIFTYDIPITKTLLHLGYVPNIEISKIGSDGWCIDLIGIRSNERLLIVDEFDEEPSGCLLLDDKEGFSNTFTIYTAPLAEKFNEFGITVTTVSPDKKYFEDAIEGIVGNFNHDNDLFWSDKFDDNIIISKDEHASSTYNVLLHLRDHNITFDSAEDVNFSITFDCVYSTYIGVEITGNDSDNSNVQDLLYDIERNLSTVMQKRIVVWNALGNFDCSSMYIDEHEDLRVV